jgi:hypothetical protein
MIDFNVGVSRGEVYEIKRLDSNYFRMTDSSTRIVIWFMFSLHGKLEF